MQLLKRIIDNELISLAWAREIFTPLQWLVPVMRLIARKILIIVPSSYLEKPPPRKHYSIYNFCTMSE